MTSSSGSVVDDHPERRGVRASFVALATAQKPRRGPAYTVLVNRPCGRLLAALAHVIGLVPNQVSLLSALCSGGGIAFLALGPTSVAGAVTVSGLLLIGYALDSADGQLARLRGGGSAAGEWLDHTIDAAKVPSLHLAVLVFLHRANVGGDELLLVPLGYCIVSVVHFVAVILRDLLIRSEPRPRDQDLGSVSPGRLIVLLPADYGTLCIALLLTAWPFTFAAAYAALFVVNGFYTAAMSIKWFRDLSAPAPTA